MTDLDKLWSMVLRAEQIKLQSTQHYEALLALYQQVNTRTNVPFDQIFHAVNTRLRDGPIDNVLVGTGPKQQGFYPALVRVQDRGVARIETATEEQVKALTMTGDQEKAWLKLLEWLKTEKPFFSLKGVAGAGKSFLMKKLSDLNHNFYFTAPTNKATAVLSAFIGYNCKTIYSLLGFRMEANEEKLELSDLKSIPKLGHRPIIVIDEAGMIPKFMVKLMKQLADEYGWRFINVGDPYQLNPIGESISAIWKLTRDDPDSRSMMSEVKRFDNQILACSIAIREAIKSKDFSKSPIRDDNSGDEGVFMTSRLRLLKSLKDYDLDFWKSSKIGAWRNKTVNEYNDQIRASLGFTANFEPGELITTTEPVTSDKSILAFTDEEFQVVEVAPTSMEFDGIKLKADQLVLHDKPFKLVVARDHDRLQSILAKRAAEARAADPKKRRAAWSAYWEVRNTFHGVRYGYAKTAHRLQGSTLENIFVDQSDVLANHNEVEAFRALYVLATRPTRKLIAF